jgi:hypothetical protein
MRGFDHGYLASDPGVDVVAMDPPPPAFAGLVAAELAGAERVTDLIRPDAGAVSCLFAGVPWRVRGPVWLNASAHPSTSPTAAAMVLR